MTFRSRTPRRIIREISERYKPYIDLETDDGEELVEWKETALHKQIASSMTPGRNLQAVRELAGLSQAEFGRKIGASDKRVSDWENDRRGISKRVAKKVAALFHCPAGRLI